MYHCFVKETSAVKLVDDDFDTSNQSSEKLSFKVRTGVRRPFTSLLPAGVSHCLKPKGIIMPETQVGK